MDHSETKLRDYEIDWLKRINDATTKRTLLVGPTGCGKTIVAVELAKKALKRGKYVLFIAHRTELLSQAERLLPDSDRVCIESIQTLIRKESSELPRADLIVVDEAHHVAADSYAEVLAHYPHAVVYGLTATPFRFDGAALGDTFEGIVQSAPPSELVKAGWLARPAIYTVPSDQRPRLLGLRKQRGDYQNDQLAKRADTPHLIGSVVSHHKRHALDLPTVVYSVNVSHGEHIVAAFRKAGVKAVMLTGTTPMAERERMLDDFADEKIPVLVNCQILTEGWDCPNARCGIVARPTLSANLWFQIVGRFTRPSKIRPIILDHAGNALMHGLPLQDQEYDLKGRRSPRGGQTGGEKQCPKCQNSVHSGIRVCDFCQYVWWEPGALPIVEAGTLVPLKASDVRRRCTYKECPIPNIPLKTQKLNVVERTGSGMHAECAKLANNVTSKQLIKCTYEHCPTPTKLFRSKPGSQRTLHTACLALKAKAQGPLLCSYKKCLTPDLPLAHKARFQGIKMHRVCAGRARSERISPDKERCDRCGVTRKTKLYPTGKFNLCIACFGIVKHQAKKKHA